MHVVVCVKQVPDTRQMIFNPSINTLVREGQPVQMWNSPAGYLFNPSTNTLVREGVPGMVNPFDEHATEEALRIKERLGAQVTAISMGPPPAEEALQLALAMGADEAILLSDPAMAGADTLATSRTLAAAIRQLGDVDLVLCGNQTIDGATGQVGPGLAHRLGIPGLTCVNRIVEIDLERRQITVERLLEEGREVIRAVLPALVTVIRGINYPRYPTLDGLKRAASTQIPVWDAARLGLEPYEVGLAGSATQVIGISTPPPRDGRAEMIEGTPAEAAAALVERLLAEKVFRRRGGKP